MVEMNMDAKKLNRRMNKLTKGLKVDLSDAINDGAKIVVMDIKERVGAKIDINGKSFEPLDPKTIRQKQLDLDAVQQFVSYPLIRTGEMSGALGFGGPYVKKQARGIKPEAIISAPNKKAPYGKYHQAGGGSLPQRKWFGISREASAKIYKLMELKIKRLLG